MRPSNYKVGNRDTEQYTLRLEREIKELSARLATVTGETKTDIEADYILGSPIYLPNRAAIKFQLKSDRDKCCVR